ncbi:DUF2188 domain-containing protein [Klebsiella pneumoniae]|uniref:DUF2188 domain-containing protein n=1 Tax=Klebsiella TaxID=570 RepID=UPI000C7EFC6E|nr:MULTISPECIES: DUF2188 domain-containing protein [Klebsiella]HDK6402059.1 DUF2188 domain-containing protein [Klebsiella variicola]MBK2422219.1 DUF2188 domain-containing protein [Klebsiella pneumoniae]MBM0248890.1 DUF2188 domain-containing protein [Klebsiella pneumoniae]MBZ6611609.1 DUF2188 domain-containing protein [Klebsiella pneumoniae]MBZ7616388.1 DUF2188 domain-containing protein [Klebsiella michiganensis]
MKNYYSIYKSGDNWIIKTSNNTSQLSKNQFRTQKEAISAAKNLIKNGGVIAVHTPNGEVRDVISQPSNSWGIKKANTTSSRVNKQSVFRTLASHIEKDKV